SGRCPRGRLFRRGGGLRKGRPAFTGRCGFGLGAALGSSLFLPGGGAHGFLTLVENCDVLYQVDRIYRPGFDAGLRWDDPAFAVAWPARPDVISSRDAAFPNSGEPLPRQPVSPSV